MQNRVSPGTQIALHADDTKIWRGIVTPNDHKILQNYINALFQWSIENKMRFHAEKCKVLSINHFHYNLFSKLPFFLYPYQINDVLLDYCTEEKDLGIIITDKFHFTNHHHEILSKAINQFNLLRRTCHFVKNSHKRRTPYLVLVRSLLDHGSQVWCPNINALNHFENFQKSCVKWIVKEQFTHYNEVDYLEKLSSLNILPLEYKFILSDLLLFHKLVYEQIPVRNPKEITNLSKRTRSNANVSHKYQVCCDLQVRKNVQCNSYFVRVVHHWNLLPDKCREIPIPTQFRSAVIDYLWSLVKKCFDELKNDTTSFEIEPD